MTHKKRGATVLNMVLLIAGLVIAVIIILSLKNIFFWQAQNVEQDMASDIIEIIAREIEQSQSYAQERSFEITIPFAVTYFANITPGKITLTFPESGIKVIRPFIVPNTYVLPSSFDSSGTVTIYKMRNVVYVTDHYSCVLTDDVCDLGCIMENVCDPACYKDSLFDEVCNPLCIDTNGDKKTDGLDADTICDPDCYNEVKQGFFYDVDCLKSSDDVCDPDTHNQKDGFCDTDCKGTNGVCDPDCEGYDADCPHKDNGRCELDLGENCKQHPTDCLCSSGKSCKSGCDKYDQALFDARGCVDDTLVKKGNQTCTYSCECEDGLVCDHTNHCCPEGQYFLGTQCVPFDHDNLCTPSSLYFPSESCTSSLSDCNCTVQNEVCCPQSPAATADGCTAPKADKEECFCNSECRSGKCSLGHCCPVGYKWDGTSDCVVDCDDCRTTAIYDQCSNCNCEEFMYDPAVGEQACDADKSCCPHAAGADSNSGCVSGSDQATRTSCVCDNQCGTDTGFLVSSSGGLCSDHHCCPTQQISPSTVLPWIWSSSESECKRHIVYWTGDVEPTMIRGSQCASVHLPGNCEQAISGSMDCVHPNPTWDDDLHTCAISNGMTKSTSFILVGTDSTGSCSSTLPSAYRWTMVGAGRGGVVYGQAESDLTLAWTDLQHNGFSCG